MTTKKILEETGYYDERIPIWVDWDLRLRLASKFKFGYCHNTGSAYAQNPGGITQINKHETVLKNLEFVIEKNKAHLLGYSSRQSKKALKEIYMYVIGLRLSINFRSGKHSFTNTIKYLIKYPEKITEWRFVLNSMLGQDFMTSLSKMKQKLFHKR